MILYRVIQKDNAPELESRDWPVGGDDAMRSAFLTRIQSAGWFVKRSQAWNRWEKQEAFAASQPKRRCWGYEDAPRGVSETIPAWISEIDPDDAEAIEAAFHRVLGGG